MRRVAGTRPARRPVAALPTAVKNSQLASIRPIEISLP